MYMTDAALIDHKKIMVRTVNTDAVLLLVVLTDDFIKLSKLLEKSQTLAFLLWRVLWSYFMTKLAACTM